MTVPSQKSQITQSCNGVSTLFPVDFYFLADSHLVVTLINTDGSGDAQVLQLGTNYVVSGSGQESGGSITTLNAYPTGKSLWVQRIVPVTQETEYQRLDKFPAKTHERALDKLTMISQQVEYWLGLVPGGEARVLRLGTTDRDGGGSYRARQNRIQDLADPVLGTDAINQRIAVAYDNAVRIYAEALAAAVSPGAGTGAFQQFGLGAIIRPFQAKQREWVSVEDYRQVGDIDDTAAFIRACSLGCTVIAAGDYYRLKGEIPLTTGTHLQFTRNPFIEFDVSGQNGRGLLVGQGVTNWSITGSARIDGTVTSVGSDGTRNGIFTIASEYYVTADPLRISSGTIAGRFDVRMLGPMNGKVVQIYGYVEDVMVQGIRARGQTNFAFVAHWIGNGNVGITPTKTWHPHRLVFRDLVAENDSTGNLLRAFTFSACGHVVLENCHDLDPVTLGFNLFVGDFGYAFAQNVSLAEAFNFALNDCSHAGTCPAISVDGISSRLYSSPLWSGTNHNAALKLEGFLARMKAGTSAIDVAIAGLKSFSARDLRIVEDADGNASQAMYLTSIGAVDVQGSIFAKGGVLIRDCGNVVYNLAGARIVETHDVVSYSVSAPAISQTTTTTAATAAGGTSIALASATMVTGPGGMLQYNDGSATYEMELRSMTYSGGAQTINISPAPVAIPSGATVTLIQTVRKMDVGPVLLTGARFGANLTGSSIAKPRNVSFRGTSFRRCGAADINAMAVDGLAVAECSMDEGGMTTTTASPSSVLIGPNAEGYTLSANRFGKKNLRLRYLVQCDNASRDGTILGNTFQSINAGSVSPAAIFKQSATNVVIGPNATSAGITPVYPIP